MREEILKVPDASFPKGHIIVRGYRAGAIDRVTPYAQAFMHWRGEAKRLTGARLRRAQHMMALLRADIDRIFESYSLGIETATDNLIMTGSLTGRDLLVQYLTNGTTYSGGINYGALGTGSTAPAADDTQLTSESKRVTWSTADDLNNNEAQFRFFFPDALLPDDTYHEAGTFMDGTATADSGKIFNHALLGTPYIKTLGTDTTLQVNITFS